MFEYDLLELILKRRDGNPIDYFRAKSISQQISRRILGEATTPEIEQFLVIQLPHGCAVRAFYVIRKNFELWLCIDTCPGT